MTKRQKVVFYKDKRKVETRYLKIPKVINTDIGFELQFGFDPPNKSADMYPCKSELDTTGMNIKKDYYG